VPLASHSSPFTSRRCSCVNGGWNVCRGVSLRATSCLEDTHSLEESATGFLKGLFEKSPWCKTPHTLPRQLYDVCEKPRVPRLVYAVTLRPGNHGSFDVHWPAAAHWLDSLPTRASDACAPRRISNARRPARCEQTLPSSWWGSGAVPCLDDWPPRFPRGRSDL